MIPKRAVGALITTAFALALLFSFKTPEATRLAASTTSGTAIVGQPAATATPTTGTAGTTATSGGTGTTSDSSGSAAATATPATGSTGSTGSTASSYRDGTVTGDVVQTRFGDVQVQVTISGGQITDVTALQLPGGDPRSSQISQAAEPILRESALAAQSANIDLLSGATYTSGAYAQSLQSALDQAAA